MKLDLYFQLFICGIAISVVKSQGLGVAVFPYQLDLDLGSLTFAFDLIGDPFSPDNLEYDLSRVLISNCPESCETGIKEVYRLINSSKLFYSFGNSSFTQSFLLQRIDHESLAFHDSIARDYSSTFIRIENGFIVDTNIYVAPSGWNQESEYFPFTSYPIFVLNSNITCTNEDKLLFNITWYAPPTINPVTFEIQLSIYSAHFQPLNDTPIYDVLNFTWTTEGFEFQTYIELDESIEPIDIHHYFDGYVSTRPDISADYFTGYYNLIEASHFGIPDLTFGNGIIVVYLPILPQYGLCHRVIRENDYCSELTSPNRCIHKDFSMTTELSISDENYSFNIVLLLSYRYDAAEHKLFGIGFNPGSFEDGAVLVLNGFTAKGFYFDGVLQYYSIFAFVNLTYNFSNEISVEVLPSEEQVIIVEPLCANGENFPIDFNLIRIANFKIDSTCSGESFYTILAGNNSGFTRTFKSSEVSEYLTAPLLQYVLNSPRSSAIGEENGGTFYFLSQAERERVYVRIGLFCPADNSYKVFNTSVYLSFIAPSSDEYTVTAEANEDSVVIILERSGFCFHQRGGYFYEYSNLTNPNETVNNIELTLGISVIWGDCSYEGNAEGNIRYLCTDLSDYLIPSSIYDGTLAIQHPSFYELLFVVFEVRVISSETILPVFQFPFGLEFGDKEIPRGTNRCGDEIIFTINLPAGESIQYSAHVLSNGAFSLGGCAAGINPRKFPDFSLPFPLLAAFWTDHDHTEFGNIYYRPIFDRSDPELSSVTEFVRSKVGADAADFVAVWAIIATWVNVPPEPADRTIFFKCRELGVGFSEACLEINSYQSILTTDGEKSYFINQYECGLLNWDGNIKAIIGFSTPGFYDIHQFSGKENVKDIGCYDLNGDDISRNVLVYKISLDDFANFLQEQNRICHRYLETDVDRFGFDSTGKIVNIPCPCSLLQARLDRRFAFIGYFTDLDICYENRGRSDFVRCCYSLFSSELNTDLSVYTRYSYRRDRILYDIYDSVDFAVSCFYDRFWTNLYYLQRRRNFCTGYLPPRFICIYGDPHFITLDDLEYTFNGIGEYVLVRTKFVSVPFELLGRTNVFPGAPDATILTALAFKYGNNLIMEITLDATAPFNMRSKLVVSQFDPPVDISGMLDEIGVYYNASGIEIYVEEPGNLAIIVEGTLTLIVSVKNGILDYLLSLPPEYKYQTEGLMGNWNDDQIDDLTPESSSIPLPVTATLRDIHYQLGLTWRVGVLDSFFFYPIGQDTNDYTNISYVPKFPDELTYTSEQISLCGDNVACLFDFSQTGNSDIADTSSTQNTEFFVMQSELANFPPFITIVSAGSTTELLLIPGYTYTFEVQVVDEEEGVGLVAYSNVSVIVLLLSDLPLTKRYSVSVTAPNADPFSLSIQATDVNGATSSLYFDITVCACVNGECRDGLYSYQSSALRYKLQACLCDDGYDGDLCDSDVNGCALEECYPGVACTDLPPPSTSGECASCPGGTIGDGMTCLDLNECFDEGGLSHDCNSFGQGCINTVGSYRCECMAGYIEQGDSCVDINECLLNPCQQLCTNTDGGYNCECFDGWQYLNGSCEPVNGCATLCVFGVCAVIGGEDTCVCDSGYSLDFDSNSCVDLDECSSGIASCQHSCTNIPKSYLCSCGDGFRLRSDQLTCMDINECEDIFSEPCGIDETCINTIGSRVCELSAAGLSYPILQLLLLAVALQILFALA